MFEQGSTLKSTTLSITMLLFLASQSLVANAQTLANPSPLPLNDIILPDAVHNWPVALGWWLTALSIIAVITFSRVLFKRHEKKWGYRKQALSILKQHYNQWQRDQLTPMAIQSLTTVLKRVAITHYGKPKLATLHGRAFFTFMNQQVNKDTFSAKTLQAIEANLYSTRNTIDIAEFYKEACRWIKQHHSQQYSANKNEAKHV